MPLFHGLLAIEKMDIMVIFSLLFTFTATEVSFYIVIVIKLGFQASTFGESPRYSTYFLGTLQLIKHEKPCLYPIL